MKARKLAVLIIASTMVVGALMFAFTSPANTPSPYQGPANSASVSASYGSVVILQNGSISNPSAPIVKTGNGVYTLTGNLSGSITIERDNVVLNGSGYLINNQSTENGFGIMINGVNNVTVTDIAIANLSTADGYASQTMGIYLYYSNNDTITDVHVYGGVFGIRLDASNNNVLDGNTASGSLYGAYICEGSLHNHVYNNDFSNSINDGIYLCSSFNSTIYGNDVSHSHQRGIYIGNSSDNEIYGNDASFTSWGIYLDSYSNSNTIYNNNFSSSGTGVYMGYTYNNTFSGNSIIYTTHYAVEAYSSRDSIISGNDLSGGNTGIFLNDSSTFRISGNTLNAETSALLIYNSRQNEIFINNMSGSGSGATLISSTNNALYNNTADFISGAAFSLNYSRGNTLIDNMVSASGYGVYLLSSSYSIIFRNEIRDGTYGLYLAESQNNQIYNNTISKNSNYAITLSSSSNNSFYGNYIFTSTYSFNLLGSSGNLFYHNNFLINGSQCYICPCSADSWDYGYPIGGNYWSNYTGYDNYSGPQQNLPGSDLIGDTPYNLTAKDVDHYPLMGMWVNHFAIFTVTGLAAGTEWTVTFGSTTLSSIADQIAFSIPLSSPSNYSFTVGNTPMFEAYPSSGTVDFTGSDVNVQIVFTSLYNVSFVEEGLSTGTLWAVTLGQSTLSSSTGHINFSVPNGIYDYTIHGVGGYFLHSYTGKLMVNATAVTVPVSWNVFNYTVTFTEAGLPAGTQWTVAFNGASESSTSTSIHFSASNGTYTYSLGSIAGYHAASYTGIVTVKGSNVQDKIAWQVFTYSVIFSSSGLPSGHSWAITLNGVSKASTSSIIAFSMPNGTYNFTTNTVSGYHASKYSGSAAVKGNDAEISISWAQVKYQVAFGQIGLPAGAEWWVNLTNGNSYHSTSSSLIIDLPNGTFGYTASANGYSPSPHSGNISVSGSSPGSIALNFTKQANATGGFPLWYWYIIFGIIIIVGVSSLGMYIVRRPKSP